MARQNAHRAGNMRRVTGRLMNGVLLLLTAAVPLTGCGAKAQSSAPSASVSVAAPASTGATTSPATPDTSTPEATNDEFPCISAFEAQFPGVLMVVAAPSVSPTDWPSFPVEFAYPIVSCTGFTDNEQVWAVSTADGLVYFFSGIVQYPSGTVDNVTVLGSVPLGG